GKEIMAIFAGLFLKNKVSYWLKELEKAGVPCGPVNDFAQVFADPHVRARGMEIKVDHPFKHALSLIRNPITFSATPVKDYRAPPARGQKVFDKPAMRGCDAAPGNQRFPRGKPMVDAKTPAKRHRVPFAALALQGKNVAPREIRHPYAFMARQVLMRRRSPAR